MSVKERLTWIWLWTVAIAMTAVIVCSAVAWVGGLIFFVAKLIRG